MYTGFIWKSVHTNQEFVFEKFNQRQTLSFVFAGSIHSCRTDKKQGKRIENTGDTDVLCAALLTAKYLPSLSALRHTHTTEHFHSLAFIHSITGSQRTARENVEMGREENSTRYIKSTHLVSQLRGVLP